MAPLDQMTSDHRPKGPTMTPEEEARYRAEFRSEAYNLREFRELLEGDGISPADTEDLMQWAWELADVWGWKDEEARDA